MFDKKFKVGDNVVIVSTNEFFDENKIARKIITHGKVSEVNKDEVIVVDVYGEFRVTKYSVLFEVVRVNVYLQELENQMKRMFCDYIDVKTLYAILKLEEWKVVARNCDHFHW